MTMNRAFAVDASVLAALVCALGIVFLADRAQGPAPASGGVTITQKDEPPPPPPAPPLRLAVTPRQYDDMGTLLQQLGSGYHYTDISLEDLQDVSKLASYDVIFLTCGPYPGEWADSASFGDGDRPGTRRGRVKPEILSRIREALRTFVGRGGTLYASDWRLDWIHNSFAEMFDQEPIIPGIAQLLSAEVVDPGLRDALGQSAVDLKFELTGWKPARFGVDKATVYLRGEYQAQGGSRLSAPLLVKVPYEQGTIIFTSFHNEKQNSAIETKLLKFLVFAAVTAREAAEAQKTMISGGFSPQKQNLLSASSEEPKVTQTYSNSRRRRLRFALSFSNQGAVLRLTVRGPDNKTYEREGPATFTIDVPDAAQGDWTYTVTAQKVPYPNFPFTMTVGGD